MRATVLALCGYALMAVVIALPYTGERVLFPFHTGAISPWRETSPDWTKLEPHNFNVGDKNSIIYPDLVLTLAEDHAGRGARWNPYNYAGLPHRANPLTATFYPPNLLFRAMDPLRAFGVVAALHVFLAAFFLFLFLRAIDVGAGAAWIGGLALGLGGWITVHMHHSYFVHAFVWLPLGLYAIERYLASRRRAYLLVLAAAVALSFLAGFPQTAVINAYAWALYAVGGAAALARRDGAAPAVRGAGLLALFGFLGVAAAGVQIVPTLELAREAGHRGQTIEELRADALKPVTLIHLLVPDFFGHPTVETTPIENFWTAWLIAEGRLGEPVTNNYSERSFFVGTCALALAACALFLRRRRPEVVLTLLAVVFAAAACGTPALDIVARLPGLGFGSPMRLTQIAALALPVLAAVALDRLLDRGKRRSPRAVGGVTVGGLLVILPFAVLMMMLWIAPNWSVRQFTHYLEREKIDELVGAGGMTFEQKKLGMELRVLGQPLTTEPGSRRWGGQRANLTIASLGLLAAWLLLVAAARGLRGSLVIAGATVLVGGELAYHFMRFNPPVRAEGLYATPSPGIEFLRTNLGGARFIRFAPGAEMTFFTPNAPMALELRDAQGFRALTPRRYLDFMRTIEPNPYDVGLPNLRDVQSLTRPQLDLLRVKYAVSPSPVAGSPWPLVHESPGFFVYENSRILPRAFVAPAIVRPQDDRAELEILAALPRAFDGVHPLRHAAYVADWPGGISDAPGDPAAAAAAPEISTDEPERLVIELAGRFSGLLVLSEGFDRGWKVSARKAGRPEREELTLIRADHAFLGARVDDTMDQVTFEYAPGSARGGWATTILALAACAFGLVETRSRRLPDHAPATDAAAIPPDDGAQARV
jgi:hypothetical protein